jgi:hypothetical protein
LASHAKRSQDVPVNFPWKLTKDKVVKLQNLELAGWYQRVPYLRLWSQILGQSTHIEDILITVHAFLSYPSLLDLLSIHKWQNLQLWLGTREAIYIGAWIVSWDLEDHSATRRMINIVALYTTQEWVRDWETRGKRFEQELDWNQAARIYPHNKVTCPVECSLEVVAVSVECSLPRGSIVGGAP